MSFFDDLAKAFSFRNFWNTRSDFYRDAAQALEDKELLRDFIEGELHISQAHLTRDKVRAKALFAMQELMHSGANAVDEIFCPIMPRGDAMGLAVVRDAKDRPAALRTLANNIDQQNELSKVIRTGLASPALLLPVGFAFAFVMSTYTIPAFVKAAPPEVWKGYAWLVKETSALVANWGLPGFAIFIMASIWFIAWGLSNITSMWRYRAESARGLEKLPWFLMGPVQPILSIYRDIQSTRMLANLAVYLQNGRGLQEALQDLAGSASPWLQKHLLWVIEHLHYAPGDYMGAFSHGVLSKPMLARLHSKVRRDSGHEFAQILIDIGTAGQEKARDDVKKAAAIANVVLLFATLSVIMFFFFGQSWIVYQIQEESSISKVEMRAQQKRAGTAKIGQ